MSILVNKKTSIEKFDEIVQKRLETIKQTLTVKAKEYRRNDNPFHNFEVGANFTGESREKILYGFLLKHLISFQDMIVDIENGDKIDNNYLNEKIGDICCYMIIFEAMVKDGNS